MEALLATIQALPEERVWSAAERILSVIERTPQTISVLRSLLLSLVAVSGASNRNACDAALREINAQPLFDAQKQVFMQPWLSSVKTWCSLTTSSQLAEGMRVDIPVALLRFTHDSINSRLHFRNQTSVFKTFCELQQSSVAGCPLSVIREPLDVCIDNGLIYSLSNRRLFVLLMHQAVHRDFDVRAPCIVRSREWNHWKLQRALTTENDGLGVLVHQHGADIKEALHHGRPIFDSGKTAHAILSELLVDSQFEWCLEHVQLMPPLHDHESHSLTLKQSVSDQRLHSKDLRTQSELRTTNTEEAILISCFCDSCNDAISLGNWYHKPGTDEDLCGKHWRQLRKNVQSKYNYTDDFAALGDDRVHYVNNLDYVPELGDEIWAAWLIDASLLKDRATVCNVRWEGYVLWIAIRWSRPLETVPDTSEVHWNGFVWVRDDDSPIVRISKASPHEGDLNVLAPISTSCEHGFITVGATSHFESAGTYYYEVELGRGISITQIGWLTTEWEYEDFYFCGVGDDKNGWAADGIRKCSWHDGECDPVPWPKTWAQSDIIGCAIDFRKRRMMFSHNGSWFDPAAMRFYAPRHSMKLFPAVSIEGEFKLHIPKSTWQYRPPREGYKAWAKSGTYSRPSYQSEDSSEGASEDSSEGADDDSKCEHQ